MACIRYLRRLNGLIVDSQHFGSKIRLEICCPVEGFAEPENFINKNEDFLRTKQYFAARNSASMKLCRIGRLCLTAGAAAYNEAAALLMVSL